MVLYSLDVVKKLAKMDLFSPLLVENVYNYHSIDIKGELEWDENFDILKIIVSLFDYL